MTAAPVAMSMLALSVATMRNATRHAETIAITMAQPIPIVDPMITVCQPRALIRAEAKKPPTAGPEAIARKWITGMMRKRHPTAMASPKRPALMSLATD